MSERIDGLLAAHKGPAFLVDARSRRIVAANKAAARAYGYQRESLEGLPIESLWPAAPVALHRPAPKGLRISRHRRSNGHPIDVEVTVLGAPRRRRMIGLAMNQVSERAFSLALLESRSRMLEQLSRGRKLALGNGLRACWSTPIVSPSGVVLGAFALYYLEPRQPREQEKQLVQVAAELAAIAIGRRQAQTAGDAAPPGASLSARELQIVRLIAQGEPVKRIAAGLRVTISTVYTHRARIFDKLQVDSNVDLARYAVTHRLLH